jgi:hypothetical protein
VEDGFEVSLEGKTTGVSAMSSQPGEDEARLITLGVRTGDGGLYSVDLAVI